MTHHLHTTYSDGRDSPQAMVEAALARGWPALGFSDHAYVEGETWCMPFERIDAYFAELSALRERYAGRIELAIGLEHDWREPGGFAPDPRVDYWIGSFHFFEVDGAKHAIDGSLDMVTEALAVAAGGSGRRFAERYYNGVVNLLDRAKPPVLGHFDLLRKHNPRLGFYQGDEGWYRDLVEGALDAAERSGTIIEVNTGGMARGYSDEPYPSWDILRRVKERGLPIQLNSDCHRAEWIDFAYGPVAERLRALGFREQRVWRSGTWRDVGL